MKIFIFRKRKLFIFCLIIFIIAVCFLYLTFKNSPSLAVELDYNCVISEESRNNIRNLTSRKEKIAYLTFDDGPNPLVTPKILDILKNENTLVVLMHDTKDVNNSSLVLEDSIAYLKSQGYSFGNFYDLMQNETFTLSTT